VPADEQLNIRVAPGTKKKFRARALREGLTQQQLLVALLKQRGKLPLPDPEPEPVPAAAKPAPPPTAADHRDFAVWLAGRTGTPQALCRSAIKAGRVRIAGIPYMQDRITQETLARGVTYDGEPV
jgi:hypothetical protein